MSEADSSPVLATGLRKQYGSRTVLDGVDLAITAGEVFVLLGPNGAGKTTLVAILHGAVSRNSGQLSVLGCDPARAPQAMRAQIGVVPQNTGVHADLTVREVVTHFAAFYPAPLDVHDVIEMVGLGDCARSLVTRLSGGQKRRLDVATAVVGDPRLIFLDEPTTGLDPEARREAWEVIRWFQDRGATTLLTTHYLDEAAVLADRVAVLINGRIVALGTPAGLCGSPSLATIEFELENRLRERALPPLGSAEVIQAHPSEGSTRMSVETATPTATMTTLARWANAAGVRELAGLQITWPSLDDTYADLIRRHGSPEDTDRMGRAG